MIVFVALTVAVIHALAVVVVYKVALVEVVVLLPVVESLLLSRFTSSK